MNNTKEAFDKLNQFADELNRNRLYAVVDQIAHHVGATGDNVLASVDERSSEVVFCAFGALNDTVREWRAPLKQLVELKEKYNLTSNTNFEVAAVLAMSAEAAGAAIGKPSS